MNTSLLLSAVSSDDDTDYRGRRYDPIVADPQNLCAPRAKSRQDGTRRRQFPFGVLPLDSQNLPARPEQSGGPSGKPVKRGDRPRGRHVGLDDAGHLLGTGTDDSRVRQIQLANALLQEDRTAKQRLEKDHAHPGPEHGQHYSRQPRARSDVDELATIRQQLGNHRAVQQVPVPEAGRLPGADQAACDAFSGEQVSELDRLGECRTEYFVGT
jgi:hypothetical protein